MMDLNNRYSRQIAFWEESGQASISAASVFIAGVGGLGTALSHLLVRAGVGKLVLCDDGVVDVPDLNRQSLYIERDIGKHKVDVACKVLRKINPHTEIQVSFDRIQSTLEIPAETAVVADCLDNYASRIFLYQKLSSNQLFVHGGVDAATGQVLTLQKSVSQDLGNLFTGLTDQPNKVIPVTPDTVFCVASVMAREIFHILLGKPQLKDRFWIMNFSDFSTSFLEV